MMLEIKFEALKLVMQCEIFFLFLFVQDVSIPSMIYGGHKRLMKIPPPQSHLQQQCKQNWPLAEVQHMMYQLFLQVVQVLEPILDLLCLIFL